MPANPVATLSPYIASPTYEWDGNDGNWSSFRISVGNPGQDFRVLVSTRGNVPWVPTSEGCNAGDNNCGPRRGVQNFDGDLSTGFQPGRSNTWKMLDIYSLDLEKNLDVNDTGGIYGFDTVRLGFSHDPNTLEVNGSQLVAVSSNSSYMGILGLSDALSDVSNTDKPVNSFIQDLNDSNQIPSLSYGYTAGAHHQYKGVHGSLVIGGYDRSRFKSTPYNFSFSQTDVRSLGVGIQSISTNFSLVNQGGYTLTKDGHFSAIDSTVSHLWLPGDVCDHFKTAFSLTYDVEKNYYLISDTVREKLLAQNTTFTFKLGNDISVSNDSINIELPYAAFDQSIGAPVYTNMTRYFPIRRSNDSAQYTIGRVFLQEAYLIVDHERQSFSLAQANFSTDPSQPRDVRTIFSTDYVAPTPPSELSSGAKAGIAIGALAGLLILFGALYLCWYRPRRAEQVRRQREASIVSAAPPYTENIVPPNYHDGKPYDAYYATGGPGQPASEMLASTEHQGSRPELEGVGVGGGSYELLASAGAAREGRLHEMDAGNGDAADGEGGEEEGTERERRASAAVAPTER
ncbi:hypothetical protein SLS56_000639 [Neofusicoccum ribis]|uniref:Peptidase A1 domain-containing protein n=1 Tax=Neofusicoccum ribis TaxID=45134 RepID=A0ABR3TDQ9_9PEZI